MKRIKPTENARLGVALPLFDVEQEFISKLNCETTIFLGNVQTVSSCLRCPDAPCIKFSTSEIDRPLSIAAPTAPDPSVCPSSAIFQKTDGHIEIVEDLCIGCGLCVQRCPVGSISLHPESAIAQVASFDANQYDLHEIDLAIFKEKRDEISRLKKKEGAPFGDASFVQIQLVRLMEVLPSVNSQKVFRLLTRNAFLMLGLPARLKNPGDNNAVAELVVGLHDALIFFELEPNGDTLDALRRTLTGHAAARKIPDLQSSEILSCIVVDRLPNTRVDFYEVIKNVNSRIGLPVSTLPLAALLLGVRSGDKKLTDFISESARVSVDNPTLEASVGELWGEVTDAGLRAAK
jgi:Fe-S-cluster-containing hydrogenase component 2